MKVLVTGGAGFIGSHLVRQLLDAKHDVTVLDNVSTGTWQHLPQGKDTCTCWEMDIRDKAAREKIEQAKFDIIVHLAAQTMVDVSIKDPEFDASENVMGTVNILEAARHSGVQRIIFASTAASYGDVTEDKLPIREEETLAPMSFYGLTKVVAEKWVVSGSCGIKRLRISGVMSRSVLNMDTCSVMLFSCRMFPGHL